MPAGPTSSSAGVIASIANIKNNTHPCWWRDAGLRKLNFFIACCYLSSALFGYDGALIGGLESIPRWFTDLGNPDTQRLSLIISSQAIGGVAAFLVAPWLPDVVGRRWAIGLGDVILIAGAVGQTFVTTSGGYIATRFIIGFGGIVTTVGAPSLATELAHPRMFGRVASYYVGAILAAWLSFGSLSISSNWSWRLPTLFQAAPAFVQLCFLPFIPESPRFLMRKGKFAEAKQIMLKYHANGAEQDDLVDFQIKEITREIYADDQCDENGWSMFFKTAGMRRRLGLIVFVGFFSQWAGNGIISYYFTPILQSVGVTNFTQTSGLYGGLAIWNGCWAIAGASQVDRFGRRVLWMISCTGMFVSYVLVTALSAAYSNTGNVKFGYGVIVFLFIFFAFYDIACTPLAIGYPAEILPTKARAKGLGITYLAIYVALVFNTYCNPLALEAIGWKYYIVYCVVLFVSFFVIYFQFPETRGKSLEEIAEIFDGSRDDIEEKSLDPSHAPFLSSSSHPHSGEATISSVSAHSPPNPTSASDAPQPSTSTLPPSTSKRDSTSIPGSAEADDGELKENWRGSWQRRQERRKAEARAAGRIPVPPLPDLRYEQGILASIRPFIHRIGPGKTPVEETAKEGGEKGKAAEREREEEEGAMASTSLSAEAAKDGRGDGDLFGATPTLRIEWAQVAYVIFRDQLLFPLLQGAAWGLAGMWITGFWSWNRARLARKGAGGVGARPLAARVGLSGR
ncbi:hypothetical protein RQP46_009015 [Phenoliferia psychrophenolica]